MATKRYKKCELDIGIHVKTPDGNDDISNRYAKCNEYLASKIQNVEPLAMPTPAGVKDFISRGSKLEPDCKKRENDGQRLLKLNRDKKFKYNYGSIHTALKSDNTEYLPVDSSNNVQPTIPVGMPNSICKDSTLAGYDDDRTSGNVIAGINNTGALLGDSKSDIDTSNDYGDFKKLDMMTAADFDRDRYARFDIHELEVKDYVRTMAYKNCIESCSEKYMKVI